MTNTAPRLLILARPLDFQVSVGSRQSRHTGDLATLEGSRKFVGEVTAAHPELAQGDGLAALLKAVKELAAGQPAAGTTTDAIRASIRATARSLIGNSRPKRRRGMSASMTEIMNDLAGAGG